MSGGALNPTETKPDSGDVSSTRQHSIVRHATEERDRVSEFVSRSLHRSRGVTSPCTEVSRKNGLPCSLVCNCYQQPTASQSVMGIPRSASSSTWRRRRLLSARLVHSPYRRRVVFPSPSAHLSCECRTFAPRTLAPPMTITITD